MRVDINQGLRVGTDTRDVWLRGKCSARTTISRQIQQSPEHIPCDHCRCAQPPVGIDSRGATRLFRKGCQMIGPNCRHIGENYEKRFGALLDRMANGGFKRRRQGGLFAIDANDLPSRSPGKEFRRILATDDNPRPKVRSGQGIQTPSSERLTSAFGIEFATTKPRGFSSCEYRQERLAVSHMR